MLQYIPLILAHTYLCFSIYTIAQTSSLILGLSAVLFLKAVDVLPSSTRELLLHCSEWAWPLGRSSDGLSESSAGLPTDFRSSDVFRLTSEVYPRSSLLSTVSTCSNDAVLQTIKLCSVDQLSSYRCKLDEIHDKNELS